MSKFTFLTQEQCFEEKEKLEVIKKRGTKAVITDFSILLGGWASRKTAYCHIDDDDSLEGRTGYYWTKSDDGDNYVYAVNNTGDRSYGRAKVRSGGARPALPFSSISDIPTNGVSGAPKKAKDGVLEVEYGYYPQKAVSRDMQERLEKAFKSRKLTRIGTKYTTDSRKCDEHDEEFSPKRHDEFQLYGKRYVRVEANSSFNGDEFKLSNGETYKDGDCVWVKVEPIKWLVSEEDKLMLTEKIIFAGVQFNHETEYHTEDFESTDIKKFIDEYWSKDIEQVREIGGQAQKIKKTRLQRLNPDKSQNMSIKKMTITEELESYIEAGESVLLRGPSGVGKTDRVKTLYPDLVYIKLTNNMFPEKVVGSTNLQTGESIPPDFAKQIILDSATEEERKLVEENIQNIYGVADKVFERSKESDKKVVILLDELLNVKPAVQSLVYTLVLNRFVEMGKGLKLPDNVVIVATGNQKKYSMVAEDLAEPLEKRINHIIDVEPRVGEWITEYAIPNGVHPQVIGYMLSKYNSNRQSEKIRDIGYFYEEPEVGEKHLDKYGQKGRTNDPRSWTQISETLKNFESDLQKGKFEGIDVEDALKRRIGTKLREEWAEEFYDFYNMPTLTPEEVVAGKYSKKDLPQDINERFAFMTALITADEGQVKACREFIRKYCDPEYLATFDICWAGKDEKRIRKIDELQTLDELNSKIYNASDAREYVRDGMAGFEEIDLVYKEHQKDKDDEEKGR